MRTRLATGLSAAAGSVEAYYAVQFGQKIVYSQLADPVISGILWPVSVIATTAAVLLGTGIMFMVSAATLEEVWVQTIADKANFSWHGVGGMFGAGAAVVVLLDQLIVLTPALSPITNHLTPLVSYALVTPPIIVASWKLWTGPEPDLLQHPSSDECDYDVETIRRKTSDFETSDDHTPEPTTRTGDTEVESGNKQSLTQTTQQGADTELKFDWQNDTGITFADVGGLNDAKRKLKTRVIDPLERPRKADALGVSVSNVIFYGPPGSGKSHLAQALASELDVPAVILSGADLQSKWINESASKVNELFKEAEQIAAKEGGALIFLDELDSVLQQRDSGGAGHAEDMKVVNEFLNHLEDTDTSNIVFVGATNRLQELDTAGTRAGRIDTKIEVGKPDKETREAILHTQLADRAHSLPDELVSHVAEKTKGDVAADLTQIVEDAASEALQRSGEAIQPCDVSTVMNRRN